MYYDINKQEYTLNKPSGSRGSSWVECYEKTGKALSLEDLKPFPNLYQTFRTVSVEFWNKLYGIAAREMDDYEQVFRTNFETDIEYPIFGVYIKTYSDFLEFLELTPDTRWTEDSYDENFLSKYMGFDKTLVWDYFTDQGTAREYFLNNVYTLEDYKNQFLKQKQVTDGTNFKIKRPIAQITRGAEVRGNPVQGRLSRVTITSRPISHQEVVIS